MLVCETLLIVHICTTHIAHTHTLHTHTLHTCGYTQMVKEQKGRLLELTRSKQEMMDQLQVRGAIHNASLAPPLPFPSPNALPFPSPNALSFPSPNALPFPSPNALPFPSPNALSFPSPNALPCPSPNALPFPSSNALPFPSPNALPFPSPNALPFPSPNALPFPSPNAPPLPLPYSTLSVNTLSSRHCWHFESAVMMTNVMDTTPSLHHLITPHAYNHSIMVSTSIPCHRHCIITTIPI